MSGVEYLILNLFKLRQQKPVFDFYYVLENFDNIFALQEKMFLEIQNHSIL
jgi:hypothetical protein